MHNHLDRNLIGYGPNPPDPQWPDGARIAVSFVLNYEEGGENTILNGDPASEVYLTEVPGGTPLQGERDYSTESVYEYGSRAGFWRLHREFTRRGLPLTVLAVGLALERNPEAAAAMGRAGWEVIGHGWRWIDYGDMPEAEERAHIRRTNEAIERLCGRRPAGWFTGRTSLNTRRLAVELGALYDSDSFADDLPYWVEVAGGPHLVVPYSLEANDFKFLQPNGFVTGDDFYHYLVETFEQLYEEGATAPRLMNVGLHCRIGGRPARAHGLARFLDHVIGFPDVWVATREQIAEHWRAAHPPQGPLPRG